MKRVGQPSHSFLEAKIGDIIYNKARKQYGKIIKRVRCDEPQPKYCHSCKVDGMYFNIQRLDGRESCWCYGLWEDE